MTPDETRRHRGATVGSGKWRNRLLAWIRAAQTGVFDLDI
jgi:hypothetical protein